MQQPIDFIRGRSYSDVIDELDKVICPVTRGDIWFKLSFGLVADQISNIRQTVSSELNDLVVDPAFDYPF